MKEQRNFMIRRINNIWYKGYSNRNDTETSMPYTNTLQGFKEFLSFISSYKDDILVSLSPGGNRVYPASQEAITHTIKRAANTRKVMLSSINYDVPEHFYDLERAIVSLFDGDDDPERALDIKSALQNACEANKLIKGEIRGNVAYRLSPEIEQEIDFQYRQVNGIWYTQILNPDDSETTITYHPSLRSFENLITKISTYKGDIEAYFYPSNVNI